MQLGLLVLLKLQGRAAIRRMLRGAKTPNGAILFGIGLVAFALWLGLTVIPSLSLERTDPELVRAVAPLVLLAICVFTVVASVGGQTVFFSPSEIEFLFTAPFSRRELLTYKLGKGMMAAIPTAFICTLLSLRHVGSWLAGYTGFFLGLVFVQLSSMAFVLIGQTMADRAYAETRKLILLVLLVLLTAGLAQAAFVGGPADPVEVAQRFRHSWLGHCLLGAFEVFGRTISAENLYPELAEWGVFAMTIDLALAILVVRLDANFMEAVSDSSQILNATALLSGREDPKPTSGDSTARWCLPQFPLLGGAGPIAWRQLTNALRNSRKILWVLLVMAATVGPVLAAAAVQGRRVGSVTAGILWLIFFIPMMFRLDFRSEMKHLDWLKMLPVNSTALALGEIAPPALLTTLIQVLLISGLALFSRGWGLPLWLASVFALPFNGLLFAIENLLFLLFPARVGSVTPGSLAYFGRQFAFFLAKTVLLAPCCALALILGGLAFNWLGESWPAFFVVCWCSLTLEVAGLLPCVAWAFRRLDISRHVLA